MSGEPLAAADPSNCPICGEWRDAPTADCANCGWGVSPCGRCARVRLLRLGRTELVKRVMRFDDRTWNELLPWSAEHFADVLIARWRDSGWQEAPSGQPLFMPNFGEIRAAINQLPANTWEDAHAALDELETAFGSEPSR